MLGDPLPRAFSLIAIHKYGIRTSSAEALAEAQLAAKLPLSEEHREDLRHLPIVAIDPADARDHDDAIWAEPDEDGGFRAVVAIADVSFYVRPGGQVDREARKRGNSVYFPDRVVPMLPEVLSADVCSLKQGVDRAAMACHLKIDSHGRVKDWRFTRALVRIAEVIAYEDAGADRFGRGGRHKNLRPHGRRCSAPAFRDPLGSSCPSAVVLDEHGKIAASGSTRAPRGRDFMIAANVAAAKALSKARRWSTRPRAADAREADGAQGVLKSIGKSLALGQVITPSLFNRMLKDIADEAEKALVMEAVLRSQTQAYYGPKNAGHFGLSLGSYAHFTSPIRRYADLIVHRALVDSFQLEQPKPKGKLPDASGLPQIDRADLSKVTDAISQTERRAMEAERDTIDRYVAAWLSGRVGETFRCRITGVQSFGFFATILGLGGDGLVRSTRRTGVLRYDLSFACAGRRRHRHALRGRRHAPLRLAGQPADRRALFEVIGSDGCDRAEGAGRKRRRGQYVGASAAGRRTSGIRANGGIGLPYQEDKLNRSISSSLNPPGTQQWTRQRSARPKLSPAARVALVAARAPAPPPGCSAI